jgi:hypothetical protein
MVLRERETAQLWAILFETTVDSIRAQSCFRALRRQWLRLWRLVGRSLAGVAGLRIAFALVVVAGAVISLSASNVPGAN